MAEIRLTKYEKKQIEEIKKWRDKKPGKISETIDGFFDPILGNVSKIIPESVITSILDALNEIGKVTAFEKDICKSGKVDDISDLLNKNLETCDKLANSVHNWALGVTGAEGAALGAFGAATIPLDIVTLMGYAIRTIHKIGLCYGFRVTTETEKEMILEIFSIASSKKIGEKNKILIYPYGIKEHLSKFVDSSVATNTGAIVTEKVAELAGSVIADKTAESTVEKTATIAANRATQTVTKKVTQSAAKKTAKSATGKVAGAAAKKTAKSATGKVAGAATKKTTESSLEVLANDAVKKTGESLAKKSPTKSVPWLAMTLGAMVNVSYITDVCWAARRAFQKWWLMENGKWDNERFKDVETEPMYPEGITDAEYREDNG